MLKTGDLKNLKHRNIKKQRYLKKHFLPDFRDNIQVILILLNDTSKPQ